MKKITTIMFLSTLLVGTAFAQQGTYPVASNLVIVGGQPTSPITNGQLRMGNIVPPSGSTVTASSIWKYQIKQPFGLWVDVTPAQVGVGDVLSGNQAQMQNTITPNPSAFTTGTVYQFRLIYIPVLPNVDTSRSDIQQLKFSTTLLPLETIKLTATNGKANWTIEGITVAKLALQTSTDSRNWTDINLPITQKEQNLQQGFNGYIRLVVTTPNNSQQYSSIVAVKGGTTTGPKVRENPVRDILTVDNAKAVTIFAANGKSILTTNKSQNIDVSEFNSGMYYIQATDNNGNMQPLKFIKQR